jgi:formylmethanofuran dehydrogenase subunit E
MSLPGPSDLPPGCSTAALDRHLEPLVDCVRCGKPFPASEDDDGEEICAKCRYESDRDRDDR